MPGLLPPSLRERVPGPELMDAIDEIGGEELRTTLDELRVINRRLGGLRTSVRALDDLAERAGLSGAIDVLDIGGGSGDAAQAILAWARRRGLSARVTVIDLHPETAARAAELLHDVEGARAAAGDLFDLPAESYDVVHAGLFLHHFDGDGAARALAAMARVARRGVVVNDLHRHWLPWTLVRWITAAFSSSRLVRADAPHSVARAFTSADWQRLGREAGLDLRWRRSWAWRWAVSGVRR